MNKETLNKAGSKHPQNSSVDSREGAYYACHSSAGGMHVHTHGSNIAFAFIINLFFALFTWGGSLLTSSAALGAESLHTLGDTLSVGLAWVLEKISKKPGDNRYTYGYRRFSILAAIIISLLLIVISVGMLASGIAHLFNFHLHIGHSHGVHDAHSPNALGMLVVAAVGLLLKGIAALRLRRGNSLNEKAVMYHMLMDSLSWFVILLTSLVMLLFHIPVLDYLLSIAIALLILYHMVPNFIRAFRILLQAAPKGIRVASLKEDIERLAYVNRIENFHLWTLDGCVHVLTIHIYYSKKAIRSNLSSATASATSKAPSGLSLNSQNIKPISIEQMLRKEVRRIADYYHIDECTIELIEEEATNS